MAKKERKTTIHLDPRVSQKYATWFQDGSMTSKQDRALVGVTVSCRIDTLCSDIFFKVWVNDEMQLVKRNEEYNMDSFFVVCVSGDEAAPFQPATLKVEVYRVPDTFDTARFIGTLTGQLTAEGLVVDSMDNVTAHPFINDRRESSQYSPERTRAALATEKAMEVSNE